MKRGEGKHPRVKGRDHTSVTAKEALGVVQNPMLDGMSFHTLTANQIRAIYRMGVQAGKQEP